MNLNNLILLNLGGSPLYASAAVITVGYLAAVLLTLALYRERHRSAAAVLWLAVFGFVFGVLFARVLHWYFNAETYASLLGALTDYSVGSYCLPGMLLGIWLAAWLAKKARLTATVGELLDAAAPGVALLIAFIRLSALFNTTCRSRILVTAKWLQFLPFAVATKDAAGNTSYRMASFAIEFLLMLAVTGLTLRFFHEKGFRRMKKGAPRTGHTACYFTLLYAVVAVVLDSTRYDSPLMHFRVISVLNQYSAFISLAQVFAGFTVLGVLIRYCAASVRCNGWHWYQPASWLGFGLGLFAAIKLGEYNVQRYATYLKCYTIMTASLVGLAVMTMAIYRTCVSRRALREDGE